MRYIYSDSKLINIDNISTMEIVMNEIIITLNSGRKLRVYTTSKDSDLDVVFSELLREIRCSEDDIDWYIFRCHIQWYQGIEDGTWFI